MPCRILLPMRPVQHVPRETYAAFSFGDLISPDTGTYLYLGLGLLLPIWYALHPFSSISAKIGLADVIGPVSVTDKVKWGDFDHRSDIDLTCDLFNLNPL